MGVARAGSNGAVFAVTGKLTVDLPSAGAAAVTLATITLNGAEVGDTVLFTPPAAGLSVAVGLLPAYVSAANTVKLPITNPTAGALDAASVDLNYVILKKCGVDG